MIKELTCHECKKKFIPAPYHIYKEYGRWFCKWSCLNAYRVRREQEHKKKMRERKERRKNENNESEPKEVR